MLENYNFEQKGESFQNLDLTQPNNLLKSGLA